MNKFELNEPGILNCLQAKVYRYASSFARDYLRGQPINFDDYTLALKQEAFASIRINKEHGFESQILRDSLCLCLLGFSVACASQVVAFLRLSNYTGVDFLSSSITIFPVDFKQRLSRAAFYVAVIDHSATGIMQILGGSSIPSASYLRITSIASTQGFPLKLSNARALP